MNEWIHISISAFGSIVASLVGFIVHDLRDRLVRTEQSLMQTQKDVATLQGRCDAMFRSHGDD